MVKIPEFTARTQPTGQGGASLRPTPDITEAATAPFEAAANLAGTAADIASKFSLAQTSLQRKNEAAEKIDFLIKGDENNPGLNKLMFDASNSTDTANALPNFQNNFNNHKTNILNSIDDQVVRTIFSEKADEIFTNNYIDVQSNVWKNIRTNSITTLDKNLEFEINNYVSGNAAKKNSALANIDKYIADAKADGLVDDNFKDITYQNLYTLEAEKMASDDPNKFLDLYEDGFWNDKISGDNLNTIYKSAGVAVNKINTSIKGDIKAAKTDVLNDLKNLKDVMSGGSMNVTSFNEIESRMIAIDSQLKQIGEPGLEDELQELQIYKINFDTVEKAKLLPANEVKQALDQVNVKIEQNEQKENVSLFEQKALLSLRDSLSDIHSKMVSGFGDDMLGVAETFDPSLNIQELDLTMTDSNMFAEMSKNRVSTANKVADRYGITDFIQYLKPEEREQAKFIFENGSRDQIQTMLLNLVTLSKNGGSIRVFQNIGMGADSAMYAHIGLELLNSNGVLTETTAAMINGLVAKRDGTVDDKFKIIKEQIITEPLMFEKLINEYASSSLSNNLPNLMSQIKGGADLIFRDFLLTNKNNILDMKETQLRGMYELALQMSAGLQKKGGMYYGGYQEFGDGNKIILPRSMPNGEPFTYYKDQSRDDIPDLKSILEEKLTLELLEKAFTHNVPVYDSGTDKMIDTKKLILPIGSGGKNINLQSFLVEEGLFSDDKVFSPNLYLETAGDGLYYLLNGNPNTGEALYYIDEDGDEVIFNLNNILADLLDE